MWDGGCMLGFFPQMVKLLQIGHNVQIGIDTISIG